MGVGATCNAGELTLLFKYKNADKGELVPAKLANIKFPDLVIEYYEKIIYWDKNDSENDSDAMV